VIFRDIFVGYAAAWKIYCNLAGFSGKFLINPVNFYDPGQISGTFLKKFKFTEDIF
jgi:hypothetical protein